MGNAKTSLDRLARTLARDMAREMVEKKERKNREKRQRERESRALAQELGAKILRHCRKAGLDPAEAVSAFIGTDEIPDIRKNMLETRS